MSPEPPPVSPATAAVHSDGRLDRADPAREYDRLHHDIIALHQATDRQFNQRLTFASVGFAGLFALLSVSAAIVQWNLYEERIRDLQEKTVQVSRALEQSSGRAAELTLASRESDQRITKLTTLVSEATSQIDRAKEVARSLDQLASRVEELRESMSSLKRDLAETASRTLSQVNSVTEVASRTQKIERGLSDLEAQRATLSTSLRDLQTGAAQQSVNIDSLKHHMIASYALSIAARGSAFAIQFLNTKNRDFLASALSAVALAARLSAFSNAYGADVDARSLFTQLIALLSDARGADIERAEKEYADATSAVSTGNLGLPGIMIPQAQSGGPPTYSGSNLFAAVINAGLEHKNTDLRRLAVQMEDALRQARER